MDSGQAERILTGLQNFFLKLDEDVTNGILSKDERALISKEVVLNCGTMTINNITKVEFISNKICKITNLITHQYTGETAEQATIMDIPGLDAVMTTRQDLVGMIEDEL